ncbi:MAG: ClbS/DfsB family four-helix bundle protein [Bacteroidales bacterium]
MARPTTKADLTTAANEQFEKMWKLIETMIKKQQNTVFSKEVATADIGK